MPSDFIVYCILLSIGAAVGAFIYGWRSRTASVSVQTRQVHQLIQEAAHQAALMKAISDPLIVVDFSPQRRITDWNLYAEKLYGFSALEAIGQPISDLLRTERTAAIAEQFDLAMNASGAWHGTLIRYNKGDACLHIEVAFSRLYDAHGQPNGLLEIDRDVTHMIEMQRSLAQSEQRFRALIDNSSDMIIVLGATDQLIHATYSSPSFKKFMGYTLQSLIGINPYSLIHPDDLIRTEMLIGTAIKTKINIDRTEVRVRHQDGSWHYLEYTATNLLDNPAVKGIVINARDIDDQKRSEQALRESEQRLRALLENSMEIISVFDADGKVVYVSPSVERVLGYSPALLLGVDGLNGFVHPDDQSMLLRRFQLYNPPEPRLPFTYRARHKDGSWRYLEAIGQPAFDLLSVDGFIINAHDVTARQQSEALLREANNKLQALIQSAPMAIVALDTQGCVTLWNPAAERLFGWQESTIRGQPNPIMPADDALNASVTNANSLEHEPPEYLEVSRLCKDGSLIEVSLSTALLRDVEGHISGTIATMIDITPLKDTQRTLEQQNDYLTTLYDTILGMVDQLDTNGLLALILSRAGALLNTLDAFLYLVDPDEKQLTLHVGVGFYKYLIGYRVLKDAGLAGHVWHTGQAQVINDYGHWQNRLADVEFDAINGLLATPLRVGNRVIGVIGLTRFNPDPGFTASELALFDRFGVLASIALENARLYTEARQELAERVRVEGQLRELNTELEARVQSRTTELQGEQAQMRALLDSMGEGVIYSEQSHIIYVNRAMTELTRYPANELIGQSLAIFLDTDAPLPVSSFERMGDETWRGDVSWRQRNGGLFDAALTVRAVRQPDQTKEGAVTVVRDVTEERQLQAQKMDFIANASHELRTPLTNFKTRIYLIRRQPERAQEHLAVLERVNERMIHLIEDLLDVSRFERGVIPLSLETFLMQKLINEVIETQQPEAQQKNIRLLMDVSSTPIRLRADFSRIMQVVINLVVNAINYTLEGGTISIRLSQEADEALIAVQDTGIGIAPENLRRVFEPFFRTNEGTARGTGLGLSISREIVLLHGGSITVTSLQGVGSIFTVRLPMADGIKQIG